MALKIALAGNPNCGKSTLFNDLTGSTQYVGNWPGVTVEKKEGKLKGHKDVIIEDLPGIYSLSPYSPEEVVSRNYLIDEKPDIILDIVDGSNLERNLYLTTQLLEIGIPVVVAVNMMDVVEKTGTKIDLQALSKEIGCEIVPITALHGQGTMEAVEKCLKVAEKSKERDPRVPYVYDGPVEHALAHIEESIENKVEDNQVRWYAVKLFERDSLIAQKLNMDKQTMAHIEGHIKDCEKELDDDTESIITNARYDYIQRIVDRMVKKKQSKDQLTVSDKIDKVVTNRIAALPIFAGIMFLIYYISVTTIGTIVTDWTNDVLFGTWISGWASAGLEAAGAAPWLEGLLVDGVIGGVGTVIGFVPQMLILFFFLSLLEDSGYMARVAFIMDRLFRHFGLSGKSFIPMLIGTGCGVPAIMASRTIENEKDRRMTIMLATYLPCSAKMEIIAMMAITFFHGSAWFAPAMYFIGLGVIVLAGIALKKTGYFAGDPAPFVMELPAYHVPTAKGVLIHVWERGKAFIIKAGTIIFPVTVVLWFLMHFGPSMQILADENMDQSFMYYIGQFFAVLFAPIGLGTWQGAVASISAELAKEQAVGTLGMLAHATSDAETAVSSAIYSMFGGSAVVGLAFTMFNVFDAPCLVAIATAFREQGSRKWGWITFGFQMAVGYGLALIVYQMGSFFTGGGFNMGTLVAILLIVFVVWAVCRPAPKKTAENVARAGA
ncbi:ferrous iron transport protein B [Bilifractor porci]|uniref:Ferrous iron transport protein B n=1 Tax=Bilifractor porci TaxID=2606636 RepID=A0A7X2TP33_9FIRM|nr:ferrous iron transport protein B [Bilifractor porci]MST82929.1 ferrous iron transport protein B [Bilifractor porci]